MTHDQPPRRVWGRGTRTTRRPCPHVLEAAPAQTGRGRGRPHLLLHQAAGRVLDGEGRETGSGGGVRGTLGGERRGSQNRELCVNGSVVVDATLAVKWLVEEDDSDKAHAALQS